MTERVELRRTPLYECHREAGARLVPFAGWEMPVQYSGLMDEHRAVRTAAGLFDVSHMGEVRVTGAGAEAFLQRLTPNDVSKLTPGRAHYSALLTEQGTYVDDLLIYRVAEDEFLVVVNAANVDGDFAWMSRWLSEWGMSESGGGDVELENLSDDYGLLALQGPRALAILAPLTDTDLDAIKYYRFAHGEVGGVPAILSRTGYTGEDGFELYVPADRAAEVWRLLLREGAGDGLVPAGLGARDTLRLEASMALYGHEIDATTTPWEACLDWTIKLDKGDFLGKEALVAQRAQGVRRRLVGFEMRERGIAREGYPVLDDGAEVGRVTSGTHSPTLGRALGMAYVPLEQSEVGSSLTVGIRGRGVAAEVVETPFYRRPK